jgi:hypothetical protein
LKWEAYETLVYQAAVRATLNVDVFTYPRDVSTAPVPLATLSDVAIAKAAQRVDAAVAEARNSFPSELWA